MSAVNNLRRDGPMEQVLPDTGDFGEVASDLCEKALNDAKSQLHPLLQNTGLARLSQRAEFLQAFKSALEQGIARSLATWQPSVQAVFKYDETPTENLENGDGFIHLLVKVPHLSDAVKRLGKLLDGSLVKYLKQSGLPRFRKCQSVLDVQQVTLNELRHAVGYGAMFCAVYSAPLKVWPQHRRAK